VFQNVSEVKLSGRSVLCSLLLHCAGILLLGLVSSSSSPLGRRAGRQFVPMSLLAPTLEIPARPTLQPPRKPVRTPRRFEAPPRVRELAPNLALDIAQVLDPVGISVPSPAPALDLPRFAPSLAPLPLAPPPAPKSPVRPAGFMAAEAARADPRVDPQVNQSPRRLTPTGAFEAANAASAAAISAHPATPAATPAAGAFGDASVAAASPIPTTSSAHRSAASATLAAEILDKPQPSYSSEARRLKIEGEVLLEVVFQASGETRVLRVTRGLGHGLDEAAMAAAREIRFRPAQRDGAAVDSSAVVHIVFQLAY
jgi:TonB family protein